MEVIDPHAGWMIAVFILGYLLITIESITHIDKATVALFMGITCWMIEFINDLPSCANSLTCLGEHLNNVSQVVFFLLGALVIVSLIEAHNGFAVISDAMKIRSKRKLLWAAGIMTFFLSAVLDNLTTTIVMVTLISGLVEKGRDRLLIGGGIVIAANAGGAWTPIGDVTTTMLWIGGMVSTWATMRDLFLPSIVSMAVAFALLSFLLKGNFQPKAADEMKRGPEPHGKLIFFLGIAGLIMVPVLKVLINLPPFMGVLFALSIVWFVTDLVHAKHEDRHHLRVPAVMTKIDISSLLFFLGILLAIDALDSAKVLEGMAHWFDRHVGNTTYVATLIGLASSVVDNVPLVAASMGMYGLDRYAADSQFWQLIAFCAGTGGSILIIGSAAGVVFMGMEKVDFLWYLKRISLPALVGYFAGIAVYLLF